MSSCKKYLRDFAELEVDGRNMFVKQKCVPDGIDGWLWHSHSCYLVGAHP